jgi:hypothetical protein
MRLIDEELLGARLEHFWQLEERSSVEAKKYYMRALWPAFARAIKEGDHELFSLVAELVRERQKRK